MKPLVVFCSKTGATKKLAETIVAALNYDIEEVFDAKNKEGYPGYVKSGLGANRRKTTVIKDMKKDSSVYDIVLIGTPIWVGTVSARTRAYISKFKEHFNNVAFFCSSGSGNGDKAFKAIEELCD
jgi:flavodoxin